MFVLGELKKSVKFLEDVASELEKIDNITDIDAYELKAQKVVFNLQMQANQVAGELVPKIMCRRAELQTANANSALERVRAKRQEIQEKIKIDETTDEPTQEETPDEPKVEDTSEQKEENSSAIQEDMNNKLDEPTQEETPDEPKVEDSGNDNRQSESKIRNSKSKSTSKTK